MMKEGDVILTPVPQADGTIKIRPAVILREMPPYKDFLVCGVSTPKIHATMHDEQLLALKKNCDRHLDRHLKSKNC